MNVERISHAILPIQEAEGEGDIENKLLPTNAITTINDQQSIIVQPIISQPSNISADNEDRFICSGTCGRPLKHNKRTKMERLKGIEK
eukprot:CAMPEP_0201577812 /NCGR_PEP_ID=MMETSP0190_2-20130828/24358_1 /ASSEMBLY_ACC=CAM_ASM_000263 /TAXON_ID=37353 /ORGANISM="Rosalina sp." /LENGTH=87 /DNA_ID=CAMNT_0048010247 /DNA_START=96 /DNA_END=356 /DNA_ORIENTATION=+